MGFIYCLTSPSNKKYIGQTTRSVEQRVEEHVKSSQCRILANAIKKYGIKQFKIEVLQEADDQQLDVLEKHFISLMNTMYPNGYNIRSGGSNGRHCEESREKMRQSKLGANNHNYGKPRTEETKKNISLSKQKENHHFYGKHLSIEHKLALSRAHKDYDLPMYLVKVKDRPDVKRKGGYAVVNHPILPTKYFTSQKYTNEEQLEMAFAYLRLCDMDAVQRLDGNRGSESPLKV